MGDIFQRVSVERVKASGAGYDSVLELRASGYWRWFSSPNQASDYLDGDSGTILFLARHEGGGAAGTARARLLVDEHDTLEISLFTVMPGRRHRRAARLLLWRACLALAHEHGCGRLRAILPESFERECVALGLHCISRTATLPTGQPAPGACLFSATLADIMHHLRQADHPLSRLLFENIAPSKERIATPRARRQSRAA
jgi:hypothetical protein